jgi:hypothetical protein
MHSSAYNFRGNGTIERLYKTMNQGLSHYVNSAETDWDSLIPFYIMAYRGTPHRTHGFSPFYLLHGRETILPTSQALKAKLTAEVREIENVHRMEKLMSTLQNAYKTVRENNRKAHDTNGIMTGKQRNDSFDQVKLFICLTLLENQVRVPNFSLLGKDHTRSQLYSPS